MQWRMTPHDARHGGDRFAFCVDLATDRWYD